MYHNLDKHKYRICENLANYYVTSIQVKVPAAGMGVTAEGQGKEALKAAANLAKKSTASLGKFQDRLPSKLEKKASIYTQTQQKVTNKS